MVFWSRWWTDREKDHGQVGGSVGREAWTSSYAGSPLRWPSSVIRASVLCRKGTLMKPEITCSKIGVTVNC